MSVTLNIRAVTGFHVSENDTNRFTRLASAAQVGMNCTVGTSEREASGVEVAR